MIVTEYDFQDGRSVIFVKLKIDSENDVTMGIYDHSYIQDAFMEKGVKEYSEELRKIWNQNMKCVRVNNHCVVERNRCTRSFSKEVPYFLEENNGVETGKKDEDLTKCESFAKDHNSDQLQVFILDSMPSERLALLHKYYCPNG